MSNKGEGLNLSEQYLENDIHPIDIVMHLAECHYWDFDCIADDQISMALEGQWWNSSITLVWSDFDETLRVVCTFEMAPPQEKLPALYHTSNLIID
tara:strand:- start:337 stop:624 length:288 start_codon:yes stop_codon:yes gene_type:complete